MARSPGGSSQARVAVFAAVSAIAGVVPLPILPRRILRAIRGAMAHDICSQRGLALTAEAREVFAEPTAAGVRPTLAKDALAYFATRALARASRYATIVAPVRTAYETLAFGRLLDRYLDRYRPSGARGRVVRIDGDEALAIRRVLDRATLRVIRPGLAGEGQVVTEAPEDYRSTLERTLDNAMITAARLPEWVSTRLDAALDDIMAQMPGGEVA